MMPALLILLGVIILLASLLGWALCRIAADADRKEREP